MFGDKYAAEEIARNFQKNIFKLQSKNKAEKSVDKKTIKKASLVSPEDFLIDPVEEVDVHGQDLDNRIDSVSSYAEDDKMESCAKCGESMASDHYCKSASKRKGIEYLIDLKAKNVLFELGKIASSLRNEDKNFAADMVQATALSIRNEALAKAAKKLNVINELRKMAKDSYNEGDRLTSDVILATIENIKKNIQKNTKSTEKSMSQRL